MFETLLIVLPVLCIQAFALALPGPDVVLVLKSALTQSKRYSYTLAVGIAFGLIVHAGYSIYLLPYIIEQNSLIIDFVRYLGALYLLYMSIGSFKAGFHHNQLDSDESTLEKEKKDSLFNAFLNGFLCNVLNPKAILFILACLRLF